MRTAIKIEDLRNSAAARLNPHLFGEPVKKQSKFKAQKTDVEGKTFHSKKEARRYTELKKLLKAGKISFLSRQVEFELNAGGTHSLVYVADFTYMDQQGKQIVEDVKGILTGTYKKKRRLMKKLFGIVIHET